MQTHSVHIVEREKNLTGVTQCVSYTNITLLDLKICLWLKDASSALHVSKMF